jgi:hypothetical protein
VTDHEYWTLVLVLGAVVIVAVVALLSVLVHFVKLIDRRVAEVRYTLESVAEGTENAALVPKTAAQVDAVLAEGLRHHLFLGRVASGGGS